MKEQLTRDNYRHYRQQTCHTVNNLYCVISKTGALMTENDHMSYIATNQSIQTKKNIIHST